MMELATALRMEVARATALFRTWGEADVLRDRGPGKWVRKEILGHLIDSAANNHQRFVRARLASPYAGPGYEQDAWVALQRYRDRPWTELVDLWAALNGHVAAIIASTSTADLGTPCVVGEGEPVSLEWLMRDYLRHLRHHLGQIEQG